MPFFGGDDKPQPAMQLIMELETKVRTLRQEKSDLVKAMAYTVATAKPLAMGIGYLVGTVTGIGLGWWIRGYLR